MERRTHILLWLWQRDEIRALGSGDWMKNCLIVMIRPREVGSKKRSHHLTPFIYLLI